MALHRKDKLLRWPGGTESLGVANHILLVCQWTSMARDGALLPVISTELKKNTHKKKQQQVFLH